MGHEKVPLGLGLRTGDPGDTADGAGNRRRLANQAQITGKNPVEGRGYLSHVFLFLFLRYSTPDWAKGGRKDYVCLWVC